MQTLSSISHLHAAGARGRSSQRYAGIVFVGTLHVALIYALINGLAVTVFKQIPAEMEARVLQPEQPQTPETLPKPVHPALATPQTDTVPQPVIKIAAPPASPVQATPDDGVTAAVDSAASAAGNTHSVPPYPAIARRLGHQGVVTLRLTIAADGQVVRADVVTSSGWPELDAQAVDWVRAHWRYHPAVRGGVPVASQAMAAVHFDLKSAR